MPANNADPSSVTGSQARDLYTSHFLSTWNARTYEFAAIIFTAKAFPDTLLFSSVRGIVTTLASICFSSSIGRWIDHAPSQLKTLVTTITANRLSVLCACVFWFFLASENIDGKSLIGIHGQYGPAKTDSVQKSQLLKGLMFAAVLALGIVEKLSGAANMMSMERDWVVSICASDDGGTVLTKLNSTMRRIDLICKLVAPILISIVISAVGSVRIGVLVVGGMSTISWGIEYHCAKRVWNGNATLRVPKVIPSDDGRMENSGEEPVPQSGNPYPRFLATTIQWFRRYREDFRNYFSSGVWIPSLSLALLYLSTLSYGATFITFLLSYGFSLNSITIARAVGSVVEISSTLVTPFGVNRLSKARCDRPALADEEVDFDQPLLESGEETSVITNTETQVGLARLGLWGLTWQFLNLIPVVFALWALSSNSPLDLPGFPRVITEFLSKFTSAPSPFQPPILTTITLFSFLCLSRLGLWIFDLTTQQLTQTLVPSHQRSSFAGVENSFISIFELVQWIAAIVFSRPEDFKWLAVGSFVAVACSLVLYAGWIWKRRGHLVHWEKLRGVLRGCECVKMRER